MWSGIVLLQNQITLLHKRDCNRTQDLIPIPYCDHIAQAISDEAVETSFFTDESRFTLYRADGRRRVYRRRGERFADACVVERDRFGGGSVMVWGGIVHGIKSQLIIVAGNMTAVRYRDEILRPVDPPQLSHN